ncbi:MAG: ketoacyl-ACP synthase III [Candidatus Cloacimonetes bacterium]|nr:ketoacyl-ACP synthase III [Candidatus Cloacimonadota bacterium]
MIHTYKAKISGTGMYVPDDIVTNEDMAKIVDTTDEWITTRTGMKERRKAPPEMAVSDMAYKAALNALDTAGLKPRHLDMIIIGSVTPDHAFPSTACILQKRLGVKGFPALDISAGCPGWVYASDIARQYIENGICEHVLTIGADTLTKITNYTDRSTCVLVGDGAGATILSRAEKSDISNFIDSNIGADGNHYELLIQEAGGSRNPATEQTVRENKHTIFMEGNKIFKQAVKSMQYSCEILLKRNNLSINDIDFLIPHQANQRIIDMLGRKLKIDSRRVIVNIQKYANTSAATIPMALDEAVRNNKIRRGDMVMMTSFGAGLTYGSLLFRF